MPIAILKERAVARIAGADAAHFLDNLLTSRTPAPGAARYAALLAPQGKIVADMIVLATEGGFRLDIPRAVAADLLKRLQLYRLRAKVEIGLLDDLAVAVAWGGASPLVDTLAYDDPRLPALGRRFLLPAAEAAQIAMVPEAEWQAHRIALGVPEGGQDFLYGDAFPHEADMDQLGGIDFDKGCYVGQEIVSRVQHRGTARTRIIPLALCGPPPAEGTPITAGGKSIGRVGSGVEGRALALVRLDRLEDARAAGHVVEADGAALVPERPSWARFAVPGTEGAA
ncbi:folate-binding protein YgfZ [Ancylobacter dichloromethanicus]|uniref:Folate-binding protein n=1 Tax=Ancylobacter dichloromethanicus TaxID=518825 RepID=A0A9W6J7R8_9HYPH|nr:folate-binding protein [Ancylobacter dichloromethanicus]MBS7552557.1 folate-binding protein YgfZ [Ancylobacter dichloromethanicus]GLK71917.1 folate-binding protein [Ancylobacter dichloromethanicus]